MSDAATFTIELLRGDDYAKAWQLTDAVTGASLIASGDTLAFHFKVAQGVSALKTLTTTVDGDGSGITGANYTTGAFTLTIRAATLEALATAISASAQAQIKIAFAFQRSRGGLVTTFAYGPCNIDPAP